MAAKRKSVGKGNVLAALTCNVRSLVEDSEDVRACRGRTSVGNGSVDRKLDILSNELDVPCPAKVSLDDGMKAWEYC